jgi:hypothetical protein
MSNDAKPSIREALKAHLLAQVESAVERDVAELERLAATYNFDAAALLQLLRGKNFLSNLSYPRDPIPQSPDETVAAEKQPGFDGTFRDLMACYRNHPRSPIHQLKHNIRQGYERSLKRLEKDIGNQRVLDCSADIVQKNYDKWSAGGKKIAMGHELVGKLRMLCRFGATVLNDDACIRLAGILGNMSFAVSKGSGERLTADHARAIRATAREHFGWDSIALAQAFQFEFPKLRQIDVIGEWVPISEPGTSEMMKGNEKWVRGLRWSDIDENMILRRVLTSGRRDQHKEVAYNLKRSVMVMEEINRVPMEKRKGPMIICEFTMLPWSHNEYRRKWRIVANKAGVPKSIKNVDNREKATADGESESGAETAL